jgi:DNA mismatch repair protein MutS
MRDLSGHTPMMAQYLGIKAEYPETLVFYRMGDFYELFFADAEKAAPARHHPHAPRPVGRAAGGHGRCALSLGRNLPGPPDQAGRIGGHLRASGRCGRSKGPVERKVVRVVTPGTLTDSELALRQDRSHLAGHAPSDRKHRCGLAWLSVTQGVVHLAECARRAGRLDRPRSAQRTAGQRGHDAHL